MPTIRVLRDGRLTLGSAGVLDAEGRPWFTAGEADTVRLDIDYTAWLGAGGSIAQSAFNADATIASQAVSGPVATALVQMLDTGATATVEHACEASDGRVRFITVRMGPARTRATGDFVLDISVLS